MKSTAANRTFRSNPFTLVVALFACLTLATPARGAFHLWNIQQLYTDNSGSLQYIQLFDSSGGQNFVGGMQIQVANVGGTQTHTFTIPGVTLGGNTFNHALLFGTSSLQAFGAPPPDFILPNNFLFAGGGSISFFGANSGPYTALPTDGTLSRNWGGSNTPNSPQNYAGQSGFITVPEPATGALLAAGAIISTLAFRRRKVTRC